MLDVKIWRVSVHFLNTSSYIGIACVKSLCLVDIVGGLSCFYENYLNQKTMKGYLVWTKVKKHLQVYLQNNLLT